MTENSLPTAAPDDQEIQTARAALQAGDVKDAERIFKAVLAKQPNHLAALNLLGIVLIRLGRFAEAETYLRRSLQEYANSDATLYNYGIVLKALSRPAEALQRFSQAIKINPSVAETWNIRGAVFVDLQRIDEAIADFDKAIELNPGYAEALCNKGTALASLRRLDEALAAFTKALALRPDLAEARAGHSDVLSRLGRREAADGQRLAAASNPAEDLFNRSMALIAAGRYSDAISNLDRTIVAVPDFPPAHLLRAKLLTDFGRYDDALAGVGRLLAVAPNLAEAWLGRSNILFELKRYEDAFAACERALALKPGLAEAWLCRGNVLNELARHDEALAAYNKALAINGNLAGAWLGQGNVLNELKRYDEALAAYEKSLASGPGLAEAWLGRGNVLNELTRYDEAFAAFDRTLALNPDLAEAWLGRGNVFLQLNQRNQALAAYVKATALKPTLVESWLARGNVLVELKRYDDAFAAYDKALAIKPELAEAWFGRGDAFAQLKRYDDAFAAFDRATALKPDLNYAASRRLFLKLRLCSWTNLETEVAQFWSMTKERQVLSAPFTTLVMSSSAADQLQCAARYVQNQPLFPPIWRGESYSHDRVRVAYLSADLQEHAIGYLTAGLFEQHDKSRFEVTAMSFGPDDNSKIRHRIKGTVERFVDVRDKSDQDMAELIRRLEIDVAIDLQGYTRGERHNVFARRPAPIQVNYLGYPGTMGAGYIDYILADPTIIPKDHFEFYSEKVVWLPDSYQVNDSQRLISENSSSRRDLLLPDDGFVFCCFNNSQKITPALFDVWMRLLQQVEGSVLWLLDENSTASENLRHEAEKRGVAGQRLVFAARASLADHLARHRRADLFLDTLPYNAHTTASDALWAGLPVLTCLGTTFAGRVAASLLRAVGLAELVTHSLDEYEALALKLAHEPSYLASLKEKLLRNRTTDPLFDTGRCARRLEAAYTMMLERHQRGELPQAFAVDQVQS
jgi:protein O-GlcNAc transferase